MMIYLITFIISVVVLHIGYYKKGTVQNMFYFFALLPAILVAGLRDCSIGTDTGSYPVSVFEVCIRSKNLLTALVSYMDVESGYVTLAYLSSLINNSFNFFLTFTHLIILGVLCIAYKKCGIYIPFAFLFFYLIYYSSSLNAARQFLAMPFCLWSLAEFAKNRKKVAAFVFLCALAFHSSSFFFLVVFLLYYLCVNHFMLMKKKSIGVLVVIIVAIGLTMFSEILTFVIDLGIGKSEYIDRYGGSDMYGQNVPISLFAITIFNYIMYLYIVKRLSLTPFILFSKYVGLVSILLCFTGFISTFATRLTHYFIMTNIICITYILQLRKYRYSWVFVCFYFFYWFMTVFIANLGDTYPYRSKILETLF